MKNKFKTGDRVVIANRIYKEVPYPSSSIVGTVVGYTPIVDYYHIEWDYTEVDTVRSLLCEELEFAEVYNSPLYKAMNEKP